MVLRGALPGLGDFPPPRRQSLRILEVGRFKSRHVRFLRQTRLQGFQLGLGRRRLLPLRPLWLFFFFFFLRRRRGSRRLRRAAAAVVGGLVHDIVEVSPARFLVVGDLFAFKFQRQVREAHVLLPDVGDQVVDVGVDAPGDLSEGVEALVDGGHVREADGLGLGLEAVGPHHDGAQPQEAAAVEGSPGIRRDDHGQEPRHGRFLDDVGDKRRIQEILPRPYDADSYGMHPSLFPRKFDSCVAVVIEVRLALLIDGDLQHLLQQPRPHLGQRASRPIHSVTLREDLTRLLVHDPRRRRPQQTLQVEHTRRRRRSSFFCTGRRRRRSPHFVVPLIRKKSGCVFFFG
mmetsp:Transcript_12445/g.40725  ORF Transcript_12445/g.40725 Transcript_12445/m.40725 type:complete len:344 (-) Transcript_12445:728-1759(-)